MPPLMVSIILETSTTSMGTLSPYANPTFLAQLMRVVIERMSGALDPTAPARPTVPIVATTMNNVITLEQIV